MGLNRISRAKRDQTWREDVITTGISRVEGIAVDWIAGQYCVSPVRGVITTGCQLAIDSEQFTFLFSVSS